MKKLNKTKRILLIEGVFIIGVLIYLFFSTAPNQVYPLHGMTIIDSDFVFEIENGEEVIVSIDENFTSPIILKEGSDVTLPPGTYYWKVRSRFRESDVQSFTIQSNVGLDIREREESYELQNSGNVNLNVTSEKQGMTSGIIIEVDESKEVGKDNSSYEGRQA
jgi:hypothetical protein